MYRKNDKCSYCGKKFTNDTVKLKSLFNPDKYICRPCAHKEDRDWLAYKNGLRLQKREYNTCRHKELG